MQLFVKGDETKILSIGANETVSALKSRIQDAFGVPAAIQTVSFHGKPLVGLLSDSVKDGSTVYLSMRLRGGREAASPEAAGDMDCLSTEEYSDKSEFTDFCVPPSDSEDVDDSGVSVSHTRSVDDDMKDEVSTDSIFSVLREDAASAAQTNHKQPPATSEDVSLSRKRKSAVEPFAQSAEGEQSTKGPKGAKHSTSARSNSPGRKAGRAKREAPAMPVAPVMYPYTFGFHPSAGAFFAMPPPMLQRRPKGVAYDLDYVDEKLKKRLLKNRQSAERSRQKKNDQMKSLEDQLQSAQAEIEELRKHLGSSNDAVRELRGENEELRVDNEELRAQLYNHGISPSSKW